MYVKLKIFISLQEARIVWPKKLRLYSQVTLYRAQKLSDQMIGTGAPNENIVQKQLNIALLNVF